MIYWPNQHKIKKREIERVTSTPENYIQLSRQEVDRLLAAADGTAALLLLQIRRAGSFSLSAAMRDLGCSEAEVRRARETLQRLELLEPETAPLPEHELPDYPAADIARRARTDHAFEGIVMETQRALGRVLSSNDLRLLFGIYDHLGLPADVIMLLLHHCIEEYQRRNGDGRLPTMRTIEKEAWHWAEKEILTLDDAEAHICREKQRQEGAEQVMEVLQIRGRRLTAGERGYVEAWLALGFGPEAIAEAYDRTVLNTGKLTWKYMDTILRSWAEKQLFTPAEIRSGDARRGRNKPADTPSQQSDSEKIQQMQKMYERLKGKEN